jgi:hypothetical protein
MVTYNNQLDAVANETLLSGNQHRIHPLLSQIAKPMLTYEIA